MSTKFDNKELGYILTGLTCLGKMLNEESRGFNDEDRKPYQEKTEDILLIVGKTLAMVVENNS